jgi:Transposase DDE domain
VVTTHLALHRCLHRGTAITHLRRFTPEPFTPSAFCQAMARLPEAFFARLGLVVAGHLCRADDADRWHGHRVLLIDGTGVSMPDTPALQAAFGQPPRQAPGCGFPVAHLLALFDHRTGYLRRTILAPLATHDLAHAAITHDAMRTGDLLLGDRAFGSFAHLALLRRRGLHGLFRLHQRRPTSLAPDRLVSYPKPTQRPSWMTAEAYAELPDTVTVREVRVRVRTPGRRVRRLVLVTTLQDRVTYPARDLAKLYEQRWRVEVDLRHLKITLGLDVLKSRTVAGVRKEVLLFGIAYNLVRRVMQAAARRQRVPADRISFVDAVRWLVAARPGEELTDLDVVPERPDRTQPRARKRRPKNYPLLNRPRYEMLNALKDKEDQR